jgi:hypothetical protein
MIGDHNMNVYSSDKIFLDIDYILAKLNAANETLELSKEPFKMNEAFFMILANDIRALVNEPELNPFMIAEA